MPLLDPTARPDRAEAAARLIDDGAAALTVWDADHAALDAWLHPCNNYRLMRPLHVASPAAWLQAEAARHGVRRVVLDHEPRRSPSCLPAEVTA